MNKYCCQICGKPLIVGDFRSAYEYVTLNEKGEACCGLEIGKSHSEGVEVLCSAGCNADGKPAVSHLTEAEINELVDVLNNAS